MHLMRKHRNLLGIAFVLVAVSLACQTVTGPLAPTAEPTPRPTPTGLLPAPVQAGEANPDEPVFISGTIPFTSRFFLSNTSEPLVLLEDLAGFARRDREFEFNVAGQAIGPVAFTEDENTMAFDLALPAVPQGTFMDLDNDGQEDLGVQVFAVAFWSNTWGGPFLERRDARGWSNSYTSALTNPLADDEIVGGHLIVWAPDDRQAFPSGFGADGLLFTPDDPAAPIPAGYNIVDLNEEPFRVFKEQRPVFVLDEGASTVNDFSDLPYEEAFEVMFARVAREYPFTNEKGLDWEALREEFAPRVAAARDAEDFYRAIRDFTWAIPDRHVAVSLDAQVFFEERGGSFGLVLAELSDGRVLVTDVLPGLPADRAGIEIGAEILTWDGQAAGRAIDTVQSYFGPYSTSTAERQDQVIFLTRVPPDTRVQVEFLNPGDASAEEISMTAVVDYDSLFLAMPSLNADALSLPVQAEVLDDSGLGYIRITSFSDDYNLLAQLWQTHLEDLIDSEVPGLILDLRSNGGGNAFLAGDFAGFFFEEEFDLYVRLYYNERTDQFEARDQPTRLRPAPIFYDGALALLVSPDCVSACEGFAHALMQNPRTVVVGHFPTAGAFGEVARGQYKLPEDLSLQFPTGRAETLDGELVLEGVGVQPDIVVPVTEDSALGRVDAVLEAAIQALLDEIG